MLDTINFEISIRNGCYCIETQHPEWECYNKKIVLGRDLYFWMTEITKELNNHPTKPVGASFTMG